MARKSDEEIRREISRDLDAEEEMRRRNAIRKQMEKEREWDGYLAERRKIETDPVLKRADLQKQYENILWQLEHKTWIGGGGLGLGTKKDKEKKKWLEEEKKRLERELGKR